jgi:hypothetical protein
MFELTPVFDRPAFSLGKAEKADLFATALSELTRQHYAQCPQYKKILDVMGFDVAATHAPDDIPFVPVRLFKQYELLSVDKGQIVKTMTSSGTSGQRVSKIFLDKVTAANQIKALVKTAAHFIGPKRLPMLIIDSRSTLKNRALFSARGAGILGFSMLGRDVTYALDEEMHLDETAVTAFIEKHQGEQLLLFGFTFMIWEYFYKTLAAKGKKLALDNGIMLHGGGWKKLAQLAVDNAAFKRSIEEVSGIRRVYNYYGMVEQTGSIYLECEHGRLHCSNFSDVIVRHHTDFAPCPPHDPGLIQLVSLLPASYPGHSILSEDVGELTGEDDCPCGRLGKTFAVHGRVKDAEIRGCSDTYAA